MKKVKLGLLCLLAGVVLTACEKKIDDPNNPGGGGGSTTGSEYVESGGGLSLNLAMVKVEGSTFTMGCESEQALSCSHSSETTQRVTLSSYHISKYEVTQAQWKAVMGANNNPSYFKGDNLPVENITWFQAKAFCDSLSRMTGKKYALPTEAQWEFAARGGKNSKGYKYSGSNTIGDVAWYCSNSNRTTHAVGTKAPNELGIYDMSGNVWEWCADWYGSYSSSAVTDPTGPNSGRYRVLHGGGWNDDDGGGTNCRVSCRWNYYTPDDRRDDFGFRVVCLP